MLQSISGEVSRVSSKNRYAVATDLVCIPQNTVFQKSIPPVGRNGPGCSPLLPRCSRALFGRRAGREQPIGDTSRLLPLLPAPGPYWHRKLLGVILGLSWGLLVPFSVFFELFKCIVPSTQPCVRIYTQDQVLLVAFGSW